MRDLEIIRVTFRGVCGRCGAGFGAGERFFRVRGEGGPYRHQDCNQENPW